MGPDWQFTHREMLRSGYAYVGVSVQKVGVEGGPSMAGPAASGALKKANPAHQVRVLERNRAGDTFGWGVVLSDQTVDALRTADAETADEISDAFNHWDEIGRAHV